MADKQQVLNLLKSELSSIIKKKTQLLKEQENSINAEISALLKHLKKSFVTITNESNLIIDSHSIKLSINENYFDVVPSGGLYSELKTQQASIREQIRITENNINSTYQQIVRTIVLEGLTDKLAEQINSFLQ
jgi:ribosome-associated toxin RatA of RatAB toxin-antitoxin module